jgi:integrase
MAKSKFYLKDPKSDKETIIFLVLNYKNKRIKYSTGESINPACWDSVSQSPVISKKYPLNTDIARNLEKYKYVVSDFLGEMRRSKIEVTSETLKEHLDKHFKATEMPIEKESRKVTLLEFIEQYVEKCKKGKQLTPEGKKYKLWTIKGYVTLLYHLREYMNFAKQSIDFVDITQEFYDNFMQYFIEKNYATNTIGKHIKNIKVIMNKSFEDGLHSNRSFQNKKFKIVTESSDSIYLTEEELDRIFELDLTNNKRLEKVRDLFIVGARTALRFSDLINIREHNFINKDGTTIISLKTMKTNTNIAVPIHHQVDSIMIKYKKELPRNISNQKMNDYIKEIAQLAGINGNVSKIITLGGVRTEKIYKKWELVTTHTARRSAATNMALAGFLSMEIMPMTGHLTEKAYRIYLRNTPEENALNMAKNDYFKKK